MNNGKIPAETIENLLGNPPETKSEKPPPGDAGAARYSTSPPDGGYGWVVLFGLLLSSCVNTTAVSSFTILYKTYSEVFNIDKASAGWISSMQAFSFGSSGLVAGILVDRYGNRKVALVGSFLSFSGLLLASQAPNIVILYLANGLLSGPGMGLSYLSSAVAVQQWFDKKRPLAAGIGMIGMPMGYLIGGPFTHFLNERYGWRGALMTYSAVALNGLIGAALLRPVPGQKPKIPKLSCNQLGQTCDSRILKDKIFLIFSFGTYMMNYGIQTNTLHAPSRALQKGIPMSLVQFLPMDYGISTVIGRLVGGFIGGLECTRLSLQYAVSIIVGGVSTILTGFTGSNLYLIFTANSSTAFLQGLFIGIQNTLLTELVGLPRMPGALGINYIFISMASLTSAPFSGWLFDITQNYDIPFYVSGGMQVVGGMLLLTIPFLAHRNSGHVNENGVSVNRQIPEQRKLRRHRLESSEYSVSQLSLV